MNVKKGKKKHSLVKQLLHCNPASGVGLESSRPRQVTYPQINERLKER